MKKILVAEDDVTTRKIIDIIIEKMGHIAINSSNGKSAYEILTSNKDISLVITDIMMPEMDGRQFVKVVRGNTAVQDIPIIMISAVVGVKEIAELLKNGVTWFLPKPIRKEELTELVERAFEFTEEQQKKK